MKINLFLWIFISFYFVLINSEVCKIGSPEDFANLKDGCTEVDGFVVVTPESPSTVNEAWLEQKFSTVTKVTGIIMIMGTNLVNITFLRNLETVELMMDLNPEMLQQMQALVVIAGNQEAKSIDLGKLTRVAIKDNQLLTILIASNTFCLEEATSIRLLQQYAVIGDTPICNPTKVHCMTSLTPNNPVSVFMPSNLPAGCQILYGGIVFQKEGDEQINSKISTIEFISGFNGIIETGMTTINFTSLTHIVNPLGASYPTLCIAANPQLNNLMVPNLKSLKTTAPLVRRVDPQSQEETEEPPILIYQNTALSLTEDVCNLFKSINSSLKIMTVTIENKGDCVSGDGSLDLKQTPEFTIENPGSGTGKVISVEPPAELQGQDGEYYGQDYGDYDSATRFSSIPSCLTMLALARLM